MKTLIAAVFLVTGCFGGVVATYDDGYPPDAYIATTTPLYYQGYPTYWYGGRWYRREPLGWRAYRTEPNFLYERRVRAAPIYRQPYGRGQYYGNFHGAAPVGGGHGRHHH